MTPDANGLEPEQMSKRELIAENAKLREVLRRLTETGAAYYGPELTDRAAMMRFRLALAAAREALR